MTAANPATPNLVNLAQKTRISARSLALDPIERRNKALESVADALLSHADEIVAANEADCAAAVEDQIGRAHV